MPRETLYDNSFLYRQRLQGIAIAVLSCVSCNRRGQFPSVQLRPRHVYSLGETSYRDLNISLLLGRYGATVTLPGGGITGL